MGSEATTFIIDVSPSMIELGYAEQASAYLEYTLFLKSKKQRKTDWVNCYLANCPLTRNNYETDNVFELMPFTAPISADRVIETLRELQSVSQKSIASKERINTMIQCLLVTSMNMRDEFKKRKIRKQIMVFTDDLNGLDLTEEELTTLEQELGCSLILVKCGPKKDSSEDMKLTIWEKCIQVIPGSRQTTMTELLKEISSHRPAVVKPIRTFQANLRLGAQIFQEEGQETNYDSLDVKVEGYPATKAVSSLNRRVVAKIGEQEYEQVKSIIEYSALEEDDSDSAEAASVSKDYVTKAYRYGSDYVVLPQTIESERIYKTTPGLDLRGFLDKEDIPRHYLNSESTFIVASTKDGSRADFLAFAALVDSMIKLNKLAVARYVQKTNSEVQMCVLCPLLVKKKRRELEDSEPYYRALVLNRLPFAEDERVSDYPKLSRSSGMPEAKIAETDALMDDFIDSMDLGGGPDSSWCYTSRYSPIDSATTDPSLPLPASDAPRDDEKPDPMQLPAIGLYRQQQLLVEYMHQRVVMGSDTFEVPELPMDLQKSLSSPSKPPSNTLKRLQDLLEIKPNTSNTKSNTPTDEQQDEDDPLEIPSLESLLARGRS